MNSIARWVQSGIVLVVAFLAGAHMASAGISAANSPISASCLPSAYGEFDFWVGDWCIWCR